VVLSVRIRPTAVLLGFVLGDGECMASGNLGEETGPEGRDIPEAAEGMSQPSEALAELT
jgi:hypothetical protein